MGISLLHGNKTISLPGTYSQIKSAIKNPPSLLPFNNIIIIDTGSASGYGVAGINGELVSGKESIFSFNNIDQMRLAVRGGLWWKNAEPLFRPNGSSSGVGTVYWVSASTTTSGNVAYALTNGSFTVKTVEGSGSNGVLDTATTTELVKGYAGLMKAGSIDPAKFIFEFWVGTLKGDHTDGIPFDGVEEDDSIPDLLAKSPEVATLQELYDWMARDFDFNQNFELSTTSGAGTAILPADLAANATYKLAVGGTRIYNASDLTDVFEAICDLDYSFVLSDNFGTGIGGAQHPNNVKILTHLLEDARFEKFMVVGCGFDKNEFTGVGGSLESATFFNSERVIPVHGGIRLNSRLVGQGYREYESIFKSAFVLGRIAGLEPQTPGTFKALKYNGEVHKMTEIEQTQALEGGVLWTHFDNDLSTFIIGQAINSLQSPANEVLVTEEAKSYEISVMRIAAQLNKGIIVNSKIQLLGHQDQGANRGILTPEDVRKWTENYLSKQTVRNGIDNLITLFRNVTVEIDRDAYRINYEFEPNFPVNKLLFTGFMVDTAVTI